MARNVEIKARVADIEPLSRAVAAVADQGPITILQDDTFFRCEGGRLKLRTFSPTSGELIFYQRPNAAGPKVSSYLLSATSTPHAMRESLAQALGVVGRVRKRRVLHLIGRTRVHLDDVEGLGHFVEIEVVLADGESQQAGRPGSGSAPRSLSKPPTWICWQPPTCRPMPPSSNPMRPRPRLGGPGPQGDCAHWGHSRGLRSK
jgi:adenylate cyclase class IV